MTEAALKQRTKQFALRIMRLVNSLPKTTTGRSIGGQLVRSGTSVDANYRSARRARSKVEFISTLGIVPEEAEENGFWLELIIDGNLLEPQRTTPLLNESNELTAIVTRSVNSAKSK